MSHWPPLSPSIYHRLSYGSAYGLSDVGLVRKSNQDNFLVDTTLGLVAVADGMGGQEGGEIASYTALESLRASIVRAMDDEDAAGQTNAHDPDATWQDPNGAAVLAVFKAVEFANARVYAANVGNERTSGGGMGTTLTGFWRRRDGGPLIVFHVGDSRLYRLRGGELSILTRDQTLYQQALEAGESDSLPARNLLLQAIGPLETISPDVTACDCLAGDLLMLCSDGLHGDVPHAAIADALRGADAQSLEECCAALIALAKAHASRDNITALLVQVER